MESQTILFLFVYELSWAFFYQADSWLCSNAAPEVVEKPGDTSLSKLKNLYIQAKELSESEVT